MRRALLEQLRCPYCRGRFAIGSERRSDGDDIAYGTVECRCFRFPVLDGILLLSLAKGYGGAEEDLQPYAPLQIAALSFLERDDVAGLLAWVDEHAPLVGRLLRPSDATYLEVAASVHDETAAASARFLEEQSRFEVIGAPAPRVGMRTRLRQRAARGAPTEPEALIDQLEYYYAYRFMSPRASSLALTMDGLRRPATALSLCCGHGILETLLGAAEDGGPDVVSVDAQLVNLLITRRFTNPRGSFICHDVQFPLPFASGAFDAVISSTCLPEIPSQALFVQEATRATAPEGWTLFDSIWNTELGVQRIDPYRSYRFAQNFFASLDDYVPFFDEVVGADREVGVDVAAPPAAYTGEPRWRFGVERDAVLRERTDPELHALVVGRGNRPFATGPGPWTSRRLAVNPVFSVSTGDAQLRLRRRRGFDAIDAHFAPAGFAGFRAEAEIADPLDLEARKAHFLTGELVELPPHFGAGHALEPLEASEHERP